MTRTEPTETARGLTWLSFSRWNPSARTPVHMSNDLAYMSALTALADPTRRKIFERVAAKPSAVADLAKGLPVSRPAVSQHLRVLKESGLVKDSSEGTRRIYRLDPRGIAAIRDWLDTHWANALSAFAAFADHHINSKPDKRKTK
jgi:DNA-binding transcriptional ArsR family regulator